MIESYSIIKIIDSFYQIQFFEIVKIFDTFHLSLLRKASMNSFSKQINEFSLSIIINDEKKWEMNDILNVKVIAKGRKEMREDFFFNFPSPMRKGKFSWGISLPACGKERDFFEFPFSHEKKLEKNEFLSTKMSKISDFLWKGKRFFPTSHCGKKKFQFPFPHGGREIFFGGFAFPHVGREEIAFSFPFLTATLLNARRHYRRIQFLVKWKNHDENRTWYNSTGFQNAKKIVKNFYERYSDKSKSARVN